MTLRELYRVNAKCDGNERIIITVSNKTIDCECLDALREYGELTVIYFCDNEVLLKR